MHWQRAAVMAFDSSTARAIASRQRLPVIHYHNAYDGPTLFFFWYCILKDIFACIQCAIRAARFLFLNWLLFSLGALASTKNGRTLRQGRHAIRRASEPTIVRRYSPLDTPAVHQRARTPPLRQSSSSYEKEAPWIGRRGSGISIRGFDKRAGHELFDRHLRRASRLI